MMKIVFVLEFEAPQHQLDRLVKQVSRGLSGLRDIQSDEKPVGEARLGTYLAISETAEQVLLLVDPPQPADLSDYEQLTLFDPIPYTIPRKITDNPQA
jgi:hypothetical protein